MNDICLDYILSKNILCSKNPRMWYNALVFYEVVLVQEVDETKGREETMSQSYWDDTALGRSHDLFLVHPMSYY